jgi:hypothetical protein
MLTLWGLGCTSLLNIDRFSVAQQSATGGTDGGNQGLYSNLVFTLTGMTPHQFHYLEYRVVVDSSNSVVARGAVENCGLGTISNSGIDVPLTAPGAIPNGLGQIRLDFFAETSDDRHMFNEPDYSLPYDSGAPNSPNILIKDHSWRVGPPLVDSIISGPLPDGGTVIPPLPGATQIYFVHNGNLVDIDLDPLTNISNPAMGTGGDVNFTLKNLDNFANDLLELRVYNSTYTTGATTSQGSPAGNVGLYRFPLLGPSFGGFNGMPLTRGKGSTFTGIAGVIQPLTNYIVDVYIDANNNQTYDNPATNSGDFGWRMYLVSDSSGALAVNFDATKPDSNIDVGPP